MRNTHKYLLPALAALAMILASRPAAAAPPEPGQAPEKIVVFEGGKDAAAVRIPSIVATKSGVLLAFAEGRQNLGDQAENKIIQKRSTDGGRTWSATTIIGDDGKRPLNNPCAVVDQKTGRVLLMFQSYPESLKEADGKIKTGYQGDDIVRGYLIRSDDEGQTWSKIEDVTRQVKRPTLATTIASGPGIGIQLRRGPHAGRILMPFNEGPYGKWNIYAAYSDDGGATWKMGDNVPGGTGQVNECQLAELSDGRVYFNSRSGGGAKVRRVSFSKDGGQTWSPVEQEPELVEPRCMASVISVEDPTRHRLLYSGPANANGRDTGTIFVSYDDGVSWPVRQVLEPAMFAYSNLVALPDGTIGCLYETNSHKQIVFARFSLAWITNGAEPAR